MQCRCSVSLTLSIVLTPELAYAVPYQNPIPPAPPSVRRNLRTTYFGGGPVQNGPPWCGVDDGHDRAQGVALIPGSEKVLIAGNTVSPRFDNLYGVDPLNPPFSQLLSGGSDAFVAILPPLLGTPPAGTFAPWSYLGGSDTERGYQALPDSQGNIWVVGFTDSNAATFPDTDGSNDDGDWDVFLAKFNPDLTQLLFCTRFGGSAKDSPRATLAIDSADSVYLSGYTESANFLSGAGFPNTKTSGPLGSRDAFVAKFSSTGSKQWVHLFGGTDNDDCYANIRFSENGQSLYVGGFTCSNHLTQGEGFPVSGSGVLDSDYNGPDVVGAFTGDGYVARFSTADLSLELCTYLGGSGNDNVGGNDCLEIEPGTGNVVVMGNTTSADLPLSSSPMYGSPAGSTDAFIAVLAPDLDALVYLTYFGGSNDDEPSGLAVDDVGNVYFAGNTKSLDLPTSPTAFDDTYAGDVNGDAFIVKFNYAANPTMPAYSSYLGGGSIVDTTPCSGDAPEPDAVGYEGDRARSLVLRSNGWVVISGDTDVNDLPTTENAWKPGYLGGESDAFVTIHNVD